MSNSFTNLVPKIFAAALPSLRNNAMAVRVCKTDIADQVAKPGSTIDFPVPVSSSTAAVVPGTTPAANTDKTPTTRKMNLDQWRMSDKFTLTAKERREFDAGSFKDSQFVEQTLALIEEMNALVLTTAKNNSARRVGTAAVTPYGTGILQQSSTDVRKQLNLAKAPLDDRHLILDPNAESNALLVASISDASLRGDASAKMNGQIGKVFGINHWMDQQIPTHTKGTAAGALTYGTTIGVVGASTVNLKAATPGTLVAGDLISITTSGVAYNYVVTANVASVDTTAAGIAVSVFPAVQVAHASGDAWTLQATHVANIGMQRGAIGLGIRPLDPSALGMGNHVTATDPLTGISVTYSEIPEFMQTSYMVSVLYGVAPLRTEWLCTLMG